MCLIALARANGAIRIHDEPQHVGMSPHDDAEDERPRKTRSQRLDGFELGYPKRLPQRAHHVVIFLFRNHGALLHIPESDGYIVVETASLSVKFADQRSIASAPPRERS